jgi:hypothetical protein
MMVGLQAPDSYIFWLPRVLHRFVKSNTGDEHRRGIEAVASYNCECTILGTAMQEPTAKIVAEGPGDR